MGAHCRFQRRAPIPPSIEADLYLHDLHEEVSILDLHLHDLHEEVSIL